MEYPCFMGKECEKCELDMVIKVQFPFPKVIPMHRNSGMGNRRNFQKQQKKFLVLNDRVKGVNCLWLGWNAEEKNQKWIHWECAPLPLKLIFKQLMDWPMRLWNVPASMSSFEVITHQTSNYYEGGDKTGLVLKEEVCEALIALPDSPPTIIPILSILPEEVSSYYEVEENFVMKESQAWEQAKSLNITSNIPRKEYIKLIERLLQLKMVSLFKKDQVKMVNRIQCVWKSNGKQRLIFDGRPVNKVLRTSQKVDLPDFNLIKDWRTSDFKKVSFRKIDIDNYYHRLRVPKWLQKYLALPPIKTREMQEKGDVLYPVCLTLPMGLSHNVYLAQNAHMFLLRNTSFSQQINQHIAPEAEYWILCYIDDILLAAKGMDGKETEGKVNKMILEVIRIYEDFEIFVNKDKVVFGNSEVEGLGCLLSAAENGITPIDEKCRRLVGATKTLLQQQIVERKWVENILGHWVWYVLLFRPLFSVLFHVYSWLKQCPDEGKHTLWLSVKRELSLLVTFADMLKVAWKGDDAMITMAVDASQKGAGACVADLHQGWRLQTTLKTDFKWDEIICSQWRPLLNQKWKLNEHINVLELRALIMAIVSQMNRKEFIGKRLMLCSDSQVVVAAINKGRSSAYMLCCLLRRLMALLLCMDVTTKQRKRQNRYLVGLSPSTVRAYSAAVAKFAQTVGKVRFNSLDDQLLMYVQTLPPLRQRGMIERLGCAFRHFFPDIVHHLPLLSRYTRQLKKEFRGLTKPPMIWDVLLLLVIKLIELGFPTTALGVYLQFDCFLRPGEFCGIQGKHIAIPGGRLLGSQATKVLVLLPQTKTGPLQSVRVESQTIAEQLYCVVSSYPLDTRIFPPYPVYRQRLTLALTKLDLAHIGYTPHSIRHGAATMALINRGDKALPEIMFRGRWESAAGKSYLQMGAAALLFAELPDSILHQAKIHAQNLPILFSSAAFTPGM